MIERKRTHARGSVCKKGGGRGRKRALPRETWPNDPRVHLAKTRNRQHGRCQSRIAVHHAWAECQLAATARCWAGEQARLEADQTIWPRAPRNNVSGWRNGVQATGRSNGIVSCIPTCSMRDRAACLGTQCARAAPSSRRGGRAAHATESVRDLCPWRPCCCCC